MPEHGLLTSTDRKWLAGEEKNKSKRKLACQKRLALALSDIKDISDFDFDHVSNIDDFSELFDMLPLEEYGGAEFDRQEAAKQMIAVAYKLVNSSIDYEKISKETELSQGTVGRVQPTDELLAFRRALSEGIKKGRRDLKANAGSQYLENDTIPENVIVKANTRLYEPPTKGDFNGFEENYRAGNRQRQGALNIPDDEIVDPRVLKQEMAVQIDLAISHEISRRHAAADLEEIDRSLE